MPDDLVENAADEQRNQVLEAIVWDQEHGEARAPSEHRSHPHVLADMEALRAFLRGVYDEAYCAHAPYEGGVRVEGYE